MARDKQKFSRSLYTMWDYVGDIGGFNDFMQVVGGILVSLSAVFKAQSLDSYLIESLFYRQKKTNSGKSRR